MTDLAVYRFKTTTMQRLQQYAGRGYVLYTSGRVHYSKALALCTKFQTLYTYQLNQNQRAYCLKKGRCCTQFFMYPEKDSPYFLWWLLSTKGTGVIHEKEQLKGVFEPKTRLQWSDDYELVMVNKEAKSTPTVTWRMTKKTVESWHYRIRKSIRSNNIEVVQQTLWSLNRSPGFSEIRQQVKALRFAIQKEWARSKNKSEELPAFKKTISYVRSPDTTQYYVSHIARRLALGVCPFPKKSSPALIVTP